MLFAPKEKNQFSPEVFFDNLKREFPDAILSFEIGEGKNVDVVRPVKGKNFNGSARLGEYFPDGELVMLMLDGDLYGIDVVDSVDSLGQLNIEDGVDWKDVVGQINTRKNSSEGIFPEKKFSIYFKNIPASVRRFDLDKNMKLDGLSELVSEADRIGKSKKAS